MASGQQTRLTDTPALADGTAANSVSPAWSPPPLEGGTPRSTKGQAGGQYVAFLTDGGNPQPLFDTEQGGLTLE